VATEKQSSKISDVDSLIKGFLDPGAACARLKKEKFVSRRQIQWPEELFIELRLSKKQTKRMKQWAKEGKTVLPFWGCTFEYLLFVDQIGLEEWIREKGKP
jgi:hypothetical protein